jgi:formate dehydrogenase subunit gamma
MLMSGSIMRWYSPFSDSWRQGATFVHDWFAIGLLFVIIGHIGFALRDPEALNGMMRGWVNASWARRYRPRWYAEFASDASGNGDAIGDTGARVEEDRSERGVRAGEVSVVDGMDARAGDRPGHRQL